MRNSRRRNFRTPLALWSQTSQLSNFNQFHRTPSYSIKYSLMATMSAFTAMHGGSQSSIGGGGKDPRKPQGSDPSTTHSKDLDEARKRKKKLRKQLSRERSKGRKRSKGREHSEGLERSKGREHSKGHEA